MAEVKIQQNAQHICRAVYRKGTGNWAIGIVPVHIVVAKLTGEKNDVTRAHALCINIVDIRKTVVAVRTKRTVKIVIGDDFVDGFQEAVGADNSNSNHDLPPREDDKRLFKNSISYFQKTSTSEKIVDILTNLPKIGRKPIVIFVDPCYNVNVNGISIAKYF